MASAPRLLFESISSEADLQQLVSEGREEDLYLEFKEKCDSSTSALHDNDRKGFSKALSGFANADGGVLVFGVRTSKANGLPDHAAKLIPIVDSGKFRTRLMNLTLDTTHPVVDGIEIHAIESAEHPGAGFVKCLIPASDRPPHRSIHGDHQYYRRVSTGLRRMEHYELEDAFGRRLRPVLQLFAELRSGSGDQTSQQLWLYLRNHGRGIARHAGFQLQFAEPHLHVAGTIGSLVNESQLNQGIPTINYYNPTGVVHANDIFCSVGHLILQRAQPVAPLHLQAQVYAEQMLTKQVGGSIMLDAGHQPLTESVQVG